LLVYIDDIIFARNSSCEIQEDITYLDQTFRVKYLGDLKCFLGLEVARSHKGIYICQRKYALDILSSSGLLASKPTITPIVKDTKCSFETKVDVVSYQNDSRKILYLTNTILDITHVV